LHGLQEVTERGIERDAAGAERSREWEEVIAVGV